MRHSLNQYINSINREVLPQEEENKLIEIFQKKRTGWEEAQDKVVRNNLLLVVKLAMNYTKDSQLILDLISEGNLALVQSLNRFDPNKGYKFSTFSALRIKGSFFSFFKLNSKFRHFKLSDKNINLARKAKEFSDNYFNNHNIKPSTEEIAKHCDIDSSKALLIAELANVSAFSMQEEVHFKDSESELQIEDPQAINPETEILKKENSKILEKLISQLPLRQQIIVNKRFGLNGESRSDLASIGKEMKLTKERVRQIERSALRFLAARLTHQQNEYIR